MIRLCTAVFLVLTVTSTAFADDDPDELDDGSGSYWAVSLTGGMLTPLGAMSDGHQRSLAGHARVSWISRLGIGVDMTVDYSPLSRRQTTTEDIHEIHFVTAGVMPRFTLGKNTFRLWLAAGGGMAYENAQHVASADGNLDPGTQKLGAAGMGAAGVEVHAFAGVGLAVIGTYTHTIGNLEYQLVNVTGGLAVSFQ